MIGIFGGTFDPVHFGHLNTIGHIHNLLNLEQIRLIPLHIAVHRDQPEATADQRLAMLEAAITGKQHLIIDDREIKREGASYSIDTLRSLKQDLPDKDFALIIGSDAFNGFEHWKLPDEILNLASLIVMKRPGAELEETPYLRHLSKNHQVSSLDVFRRSSHGKILIADVPEMDLASTIIREQLRNNSSITHLVPKGVETLISQWHLYQ